MKKNNRDRAANGQGIIEGVCGSLLIVLVFVLLTMLAINVYSAVVFSQKLQFVANTSAKIYNERHFWLGTIRPDFNEAEAQAKATETARRLLAKLGLPELSSISFSTDINEESLIFSSVKLTVGGWKMPYGDNKVFPALITLNAVGYSAETSMSPYAAFILRAPAAGTTNSEGLSRQNRYSVATIPAFGFYTNSGNLEPVGILGVPAAEGKQGVTVSGGLVNVTGATLRGECHPQIQVVNPKGGAVRAASFQ